MSEFVKKTAFGYKPVSGGRSDPECTHVILAEGEYAKMLQQISSAEQEVRNTKYDADKEIRRVQIDAQRKIESIAYETAKKIESLEEALAAEQQESALLRGLNANLLRISRERANADRGLKPKKEHTGYVVMNTQEKKLQRKDHHGYYTITLWETVLQSPYSVDFTEEQARHQICEDLMQRKNGEEWELSKIGIREEPTPGDYPRSEYDEIMENGNILVSYQLRANYQARRGEKTGFWDIILVHQKPIPQVPKDMRP